MGMGEQLHPQALAERIAGSQRWERVVALRPTGERGWAEGCLAVGGPRPTPQPALPRPSRGWSLYPRLAGLLHAGWSYRASGRLDTRTEGCVTILGIPYSEHSAFPELR